eukprot:s843_g13.t1
MDLQIMRYWVSLQVQQDVPPVSGTEAVDTFEEDAMDCEEDEEGAEIASMEECEPFAPATTAAVAEEEEEEEDDGLGYTGARFRKRYGYPADYHPAYVLTFQEFCALKRMSTPPLPTSLQPPTASRKTSRPGSCGTVFGVMITLSPPRCSQFWMQSVRNDDAVVPDGVVGARMPCAGTCLGTSSQAC